MPGTGARGSDGPSGPAGAARREEADVHGRNRVPAVTATVVAAAVLATAGCATGQDAGTARETPDVAGVDGTAGQVAVDDVFLESADGVEPGEVVPLRGTLTNDGDHDDRLVRADSAAGPVTLLGPDGAPAPDGIALPAGGQVEAVTGPVRMQLADAGVAVPATGSLPVTFVFAHGGEVRLDVPVAPGTAPGQAGA